MALPEEPVATGRATAVARLVARGMALRAAGRFADAHATLGEAARAADALGPADAMTAAAAHNALGLACKDLARWDEGRAHYERALATVEASPDAAADDLATLLHNLAGIAFSARDFVGAEPVARRGLALRRAARPPDPMAIAADLVALGAILDGLLRHDEAEPLYREALALLDAAPAGSGGAMLDLASALNNLGAQYAFRGDHVAAGETLERALALKRAALPPGHADIGVTLHNLAVAWRRRGDEARAQALGREALALLAAALGESHPRTARCRRMVEGRRGAGEG